MDMTHDAVAFFAEHAARRLVHGRHADAWSAAGAVFNDAYPYGMPMDEYARKTLAQARRALAKDRKRILETLAAYRIVDAVIEGALGDATEAERAALEKARAELSGRGKEARKRPHARRPAVGAVVLVRHDHVPLTIANVRWGSGPLEQRWMHTDRLDALIGRLVASPPEAPFILAVAGSNNFSPSMLAFSTRGRLAVCHPQHTEHVDTRRLLSLQQCFAAVAPELPTLFDFRRLCRERALAARTVPIDHALMGLAEGWGQDANVLHGLLLPATDSELRVLAGRGGD